MQSQRESRRTRSAGAGKPPRQSRRVHLLAAFGLLLLLALVPSAALAQNATIAVKPGTMGPGIVNTCFWGQPSSNVGPINELNYPVPGTNIIAPDTDTIYDYTRFQLPAGATITLHGQFPHARFFSLTTYVTRGTEQGLPSTSIYDEQINPDPGSINPFRPGENRDSKHRSYTVTISGQTTPAEPAANTLYAGQEGKTGETQQVEMIMRVYRPDKNLEANAGVPLPSPTVNLENGETFSEEAAACSAVSDVSGISALPIEKIAAPTPATYVHLRDLAPAPHPAVNPVDWERFRNLPYLEKPFFAGAGEPYEHLITTLPTAVTSGLYATPANAYLIAYADRTIGPNTEGHNILVIHAKMPTHPETYDHNKINDQAGTQVRYWSICTAGGVEKPYDFLTNSACLFDQEVPVDTNGEYTVVVSLAQDRPKNAKPGCGVAWLDWGTGGDDLEGEYAVDNRPSLDTLIMRNQLSNPAFEQSIANVITPGSEREVMGAYYPTSTYMTTQEFEGRRCFSASLKRKGTA
jgi:hypothetical protein